MSKIPTPLGLILTALVFAGCATTSTTPTPTSATATPAAKSAETPATTPATATAPAPTPPPVIEAKPATIIGTEESSAMLDSLTGFVAKVDGVTITAGREGWNRPLTIKAGLRRVSVGFIRGVFNAHAELQFTARSEVAYQVKFATDAQLFGKNSYCEFWIVDAATGQAITERKRVPLTKVEAAH